MGLQQNTPSVAFRWIEALRTHAAKTGERCLLLGRDVAFRMISKKLLLGPAHEITNSQIKGRGQRIGDLNSYIHLTQLDRADISAVRIGSLHKVLLREL